MSPSSRHRSACRGCRPAAGPASAGCAETSPRSPARASSRCAPSRARGGAVGWAYLAVGGGALAAPPDARRNLPQPRLREPRFHDAAVLVAEDAFLAVRADHGHGDVAVRSDADAVHAIALRPKHIELAVQIGAVVFAIRNEQEHLARPPTVLAGDLYAALERG